MNLLYCEASWEGGASDATVRARARARAPPHASLARTLRPTGPRVPAPENLRMPANLRSQMGLAASRSSDSTQMHGGAGVSRSPLEACLSRRFRVSARRVMSEVRIMPALEVQIEELMDRNGWREAKEQLNSTATDDELKRARSIAARRWKNKHPGEVMKMASCIAAVAVGVVVVYSMYAAEDGFLDYYGHSLPTVLSICLLVGIARVLVRTLYTPPPVKANASGPSDAAATTAG